MNVQYPFYNSNFSLLFSLFTTFFIFKIFGFYFTKDGHNYVIINEFEGDYHGIGLKKDADIAKQVKKSLWHK